MAEVQDEVFMRKHPDVYKLSWSKFFVSRNTAGHIVEAWKKINEHWYDVTEIEQSKEEIQRLTELNQLEEVTRW